MKSILDKLRGVRQIELILCVIMLALLALILTNGASVNPTKPEGSPLEQRLERLLSGIGGMKNIRVMITEGEDGAVCGAVIVSDGEMSVRTVLEIQNAVRTLLNVEAERVNVMSRTELVGGGSQ